MPKEVKDWEKEVTLPGFPDSIPVMNISKKLTGKVLTVVFNDGSEKQVFDKSYRFNLKQNKH